MAEAQVLLEAASRGASARLRYALGVKPYGGRGDFSATLAAAGELLRDRLAERLRDPAAGRGESSATGLLEAIREIERAARLARGNVNPQLIVADLTRRLAGRLA
jgi:hypothetical protein